jgi:hypothetical protein
VIVIVVVDVHDDPDEQRYEAAVDGELAGFAAYCTLPTRVGAPSGSYPPLGPLALL